MSETNEQPQRPSQSLPVLPSSGKVEQLRKEAEAASASGPDTAKATRHVETTLVSRFADSSKSPAQKAIEEKVVTVLRTIYDPEIPINIYDLGLIYGIVVDPDSKVHIKMTLTAPACPVAGSLPGEVEQKIEAIPEVRAADVELVWDPPWSKDRMSESAMLDLGFL